MFKTTMATGMPITIQQALQQALALHQAGRRIEAEQLYRQVLGKEPDNVDALHLLGVLAHEVGRNDVALQLIQRALALNPLAASIHRNMGRVREALGDLDQAIATYHYAAKLEPNDPHILSDLGNALRLGGRFDEAVDCFNRAIKLDPRIAEFYNNLAVVLLEMKRPADAIAPLRKSIALNPEFFHSHYNLGKALAETGKPSQAVAAYQKALALNPGSFQVQCNLGAVFYELAQYDEAVSIYEQARIAHPTEPDVHYNLASVLHKKGRLDEAVASFRRAIAIRPDHPETFCSLGNTLYEMNQLDDSLAALRQALALRPQYADAENNVGNVFSEKGDVALAIESYRRAIALKPDFGDAWNNLGNALSSAAEITEALECYRRARQLKPHDANIHSNLIYTMHYHPAYDWPAIARELAAWNRDHAQPLRPLIRPHVNDADPDRPLKIGYVSADFRQHVVGCNLLPLLREHDREQFKVYCYSQVVRSDAMTQLLQSHSDVWRIILGASDDEVARRIRDDEIDILVDLSLHSARNRLPMFAQKPAPVQVTYLGYCSSTGVETIDYRFSDPYLDPVLASRIEYSEATVRLPQTYWCYQPAGPTPEVNPLPALSTGQITFGSLNNFAKVSDPALDLFAKILQAVPNSRLLLHAQFGTHRQRVLDHVSRAGVAGERVEFVPRQSFDEYIRTYQRIDIALDPFPYGGGITTCDALWMGTPVVSLEGRTAVGRGGKSILCNLQLHDWVAQSPAEYESIARKLAADTASLATLRSHLRRRLLASPLMQARPFADAVEAQYRNMWRTWCEK